MKKLLRIARIELNMLFYSPIAWILIVIFLAFTGMGFIDHLEDWLKGQQSGFYIFQQNWSLTALVFDFYTLKANAYLFIPLITMGLISREVSSGTIKLLYSSPLKVRDVVLGKFAAMLVFNVIMVLGVAVYLLFGSLIIQSTDMGLLASRMLGLFLLLNTYSAIGLFMSCLTSYQVVAAIGTVAVFAFFNFIGNIGQDIDFIRDVTYYLSIPDKTLNLFDGLIMSNDVFYFIIIIVLFLFFSFFRLQAGRQSRSVRLQIIRYTGATILAVSIIYILSLPALKMYVDATATGTQTLTATTRGLLAQMGDEPLEINSFVNLLDDTYGRCEPARRHDYDQWNWHWNRYLRFKRNISFTYTYFYDSVLTSPKIYKDYPGKTLKEIAQQFAKARKLNFNNIRSPEEIHRIVDPRPELNRYFLQLRYKDRTVNIRTYDDMDMFPYEQQIATSFKMLLTDKVPKFAVLTGEYERDLFKDDAAAYGFLSKITERYSLLNQGIRVDSVNLHNRDLPADIDGLVIGDPRADFDPIVRTRIQQFIDKGGNLLIAGDLKKQVIINPFIRQFGVQMNEGMLMQTYKANPRSHNDFPPDIIIPNLTPDAVTLHMSLRDLLKDSNVVSMVGATGLTWQQGGAWDIHPLLVTDPRWSWQRKTMAVLDSATIPFSAADGDQRLSFATALRLTRKVNGREQRIVITSDADWLSNTNNGGIWFPVNGNFSIAAFSWLDYGVFPPDVVHDPTNDHRILHLKVADLKTVRLFFIGIIPGLVMLLGSILLIRRKRK
jgi:ABC-2 type transport system permease protein